MKSNNIEKVIFDTDIGCDIDDTWALAYLMKVGRIYPQLILSERGNSEYRLKIVAKYLENLSKYDVELGYGAKGINSEKFLMPQNPWVSNYNLNSYKGRVYNDGVEAMVNIIMGNQRKTSVITAGPLTNIAKAMQAEPKLIDKIKLFSMAGSIYQGLEVGSEPYPENNIVKDIKAAQYVLNSGVDITLAPIDSCKEIVISGDNYQKLRQSNKAEVMSLLENYKIWLEDPVIQKRGAKGYEYTSSKLYDTMPVYLAFSSQYCKIEELKLSIEESGMLKINPKGKSVKCAIEWKDIDGFVNHMTQVLIS